MASSSRDTGPVVSVLIPVWNVEPYLPECLDSVVRQTIGLDSIEIIAVDDGSTDRSADILDEYAARIPQLRVIHEPNSGGPGRPRNVALDRAAGPYVFFLDADDYLGSEALQRLVATAERNGSDIVLGKMVGVGGRHVPTRAFQRSLDRADIEQVYATGSVLKLFRRALLERLRLRFQEGLSSNEDGAFTAQAYFEAGVISVVADYDCYFARLRPGSQTKRHEQKGDPVDYLHRIDSQRMHLVARYRKPGIARDMLMVKHIIEILRPFRPRWLAREPEDRRRVFDAAAAILRRWNTKRIALALAPWDAIRAHCLEHALELELEDIVACPARAAFGDPIVEGRRIFARYPHFRDAAAIPDRCFDITRRVRLQRRLARAVTVGGTLQLSGHAYLSLVGGSTTVVLRGWPLGPTWQCATHPTTTPKLRDQQTRYPNAGFSASIDLATAAGGRPLPAGAWSLLLRVGTGRVERTEAVRVGDLAARRAAIGPAAGHEPGPGVVYVAPAGDVRVRIGRAGPLTAALERVEWAYRRLGGLALRVLSASRPGRLLRLAVDEINPALLGRFSAIAIAVEA